MGLQLYQQRPNLPSSSELISSLLTLGLTMKEDDLVPHSALVITLVRTFLFQMGLQMPN